MNKMKRIFDVEKQLLKGYEIITNRVLEKEEEYKLLTDEQLKEKTEEFKLKLANGSTLEDIQADAFATVREAATRTVVKTPFKVQIVGACALFDGNIAEMKTGEGKTLTSAIVAYTWALAGKGVHVVTVNDYLAARDAEDNGEIYEFLGLTVGLNNRDKSSIEKKEAYDCDITYTTNSELGFDYLRDNMVLSIEERSIRKLEYIIVDEVDSILIDEARTPLIISGSERVSHSMYNQVDAIVKSFKEGIDFKINVKDKSAHLIAAGMEKIEGTFNITNLYDVENSQMTHAINQALKAVFCMHKDVDYVVKDGKVVIVDQFTGRTMEGRVFSDGLHQAIEAKEHVETQKESKTMATITYQNFFRLYNVMCGMTGTAKTEEEEFQKTYDMDVVEIPTNMPIARVDRNDLIYITKRKKYKSMLKFIKERHELGQPILIGTVSIETSEEISDILRKDGVAHQVLNAKQDMQEADIILQAGKKGVVTIATNMAGRGTDIKLAEDVKTEGTYYSKIFDMDMEYSGLLIVGTERHESRRIDNQLRGRAGRQGDKGESVFFVSFEDDLLKRYASGRAGKILQTLSSGDEAITNRQLTKQIAVAQKQVESIHYDSRKNLLKFDDVLREQREVVYGERDHIILSEDLIGDAKYLIQKFIKQQVKYFNALNDIEGLKEMVGRTITNEEFTLDDSKDMAEQITEIAMSEIDRKTEVADPETMERYCKAAMIKILDEAWINHIDEMQTLREAVGLRGYGQIDPLQEYQRDGRAMFEDMLDTVLKEVTRIILKGRLQTASERERMIAKLNAQHDKDIHAGHDTIVVKEKVGRNEPCPCGSGKKFKNCHGA